MKKINRLTAVCHETSGQPAVFNSATVTLASTVRLFWAVHATYVLFNDGVILERPSTGFLLAFSIEI